MLVNNHQLHVESYGSDEDPVVVFLHHGLGSTRAWRGQVPAFVETGYRVIVYDRWGYGQSDPRPDLDVPSFETDLADLGALLETCAVRRAALVGHSDGGTLALYYAVRNPERVSVMVTVAAHSYLEPKMETGILGIKKAFEHDERFRKGLQRVHGEKFESVFWNWFNGWHKPEALHWDMRPLLKKISCPALIVQGEEDEHATPQHAIDVAEAIPNAELWLEPGAGHMFPQDQPKKFNKRLLKYMSAVYEEWSAK